jgi:ribosomal protein S18 acetylase RimI-like enzyme
MKALTIRHLRPDDHGPIISVVDEWWGGRKMVSSLPRLFFEHFNNSSFIAEVEGERVGFLVGFMSQSQLDVAYIHFIGVHPEHRKSGVARTLYERFFAVAREHKRSVVNCVAVPFNKTSIGFHTRMGFTLKASDTLEDSLPVFKDYDAPGIDRVVFQKDITQ